MQEHSMRPRPEPLDSIRNGTKRIEMRLNDEKRNSLAVGDRIVFTQTETGERMIAAVVSVEKYSSFEELYLHYSSVVLGYKIGEKVEPSDMVRYYQMEDVGRCGCWR